MAMSIPKPPKPAKASVLGSGTPDGVVLTVKALNAKSMGVLSPVAGVPVNTAD